MRLKYSIQLFLLLQLCASLSLFAVEKEKPEAPSTLSYADATLMLAKYSGFFDRYVPENATLSECIFFLKKQGVGIDLQKIRSKASFSKKECAQMMGQINLLLLGEARVSSAGEIALPEGLDSWEEYCTINGVEFFEAYQTMTKMLHMASIIK
jgi:hypothetical protein